MTLIDEVVEAIIREQNAVIEEYIERSLTDPEGRGVLMVWGEYPFSFSITLSSAVPWGEIHEVRP